ncbi:(2Fe-2S) ferredoxin domain-containing protein [Chamaesiphon minutus]|uniref:NADH:ubiquinone oxidoreductase 24 kD subunit n=1 Tax=Chamaesiphon minutus (strain ATCC 27169 / PCC 6605) TaxID=1173020 RepID=K9UGN2_CHAP6|nr:(2Fe-2S) ferredoxin domain-containing protein [Chamaesiphon minutus]AFY93359.1 NADH:ubiquinone oxidoreductase 24 kD subunit [Chamaesiphon minutus PCC 6605]
MTNEICFQLEGEFLGVWAIDGYKLKYLRLRTADRDVIIKVPKQLRMDLVYKLAIGDRLRCEGSQKDGKFKASTIEKVERVASCAAQCSAGEDLPTIAAPVTEPKVKILICQKSHCHNNGGKEIYSALAEQLNSHDLNDSVTLKSTGCLKCCKQAPNLVVLPVGKTSLAAASELENRWQSRSYGESSYRNVRISQIPAIISQVTSYLSIEPN